MNTTGNADAGKNVLWPGATPFPPPVCGPNSLRAWGVAPGHSDVRLSSGVLPRTPRLQCTPNSSTIRTPNCKLESGPLERKSHASTETT